MIGPRDLGSVWAIEGRVGARAFPHVSDQTIIPMYNGVRMGLSLLEFSIYVRTLRAIVQGPDKDMLQVWSSTVADSLRSFAVLVDSHLGPLLQ